MKNEKGITLIALVITIIVLLILASISIGALTGEKGIIEQAREAKVQHSHSVVEEAIALEYVNYLKNIEYDNSELTQESKNLDDDLADPILPLSNHTAEVRVQKIEQITHPTILTPTFIDFLVSKEYINMEGIINTKKLLGTKLSIGNGTGTTDVYIIVKEVEQIGELDPSTSTKYILKYYDKNSTQTVLWEKEENMSFVVVDDNIHDTDIVLPNSNNI